MHILVSTFPGEQYGPLIDDEFRSTQLLPPLFVYFFWQWISPTFYVIKDQTLQHFLYCYWYILVQVFWVYIVIYKCIYAWSGVLSTLVPWLILNVFGAHEWLKNKVVGYTPAPISSKGIFFPASNAPSTYNIMEKDNNNAANLFFISSNGINMYIWDKNIDWISCMYKMYYAVLIFQTNK